ncbi:HNH endonuclease domain-containing protein [Mucilaginibacter endophyticus]|uniref:HNH endonuclease domain-containing protein n=1 Tax=Mucilaginibacter endophyticus TaxID=2675003 RepID=UPI000E0CD601|nr:HNH endonuclease domain-containing protein [Mucilaginibacter endophyticus]
MLRSELRYAIWVAHGKRDAYSGDMIENFEDLEIDHIIPKSTDKTLLQEKISKYDLGPDFSLNSLDNLLPTSKLLNRQKSHIAFNESSERFYLAYARKKKQK